MLPRDHALHQAFAVENWVAELDGEVEDFCWVVEAFLHERRACVKGGMFRQGGKNFVDFR